MDKGCFWENRRIWSVSSKQQGFTNSFFSEASEVSVSAFPYEALNGVSNDNNWGYFDVPCSINIHKAA